MVGIYKITNSINNKAYIGQSINITRRWGEEKRNAFNQASPVYNSILSQAIRKYGVENFIFEVLEECEQQMLNDRESFWANYYNTYAPYGYNAAYCGANGNISGCSLSLEQVLEIIHLLKTTDLTQEEIGKRFGITGKNVQPINTGLHWHILPNDEYPIRERYFRKKEKQKIASIYDNLPEPIELLIQIAQSGFETVCSQLNVCRKTLKNHLEDSGLPTSKQEIVKYYKTTILQEVEKPKLKMSKGQIQQLDKNTMEVLAIYENAYEAGRALGDVDKRKHINEVCQGKRKSAYGFVWRRVE